ncbi:MAG TPA: CcdB family protein [Caulobacter sp.]|nr:CcdB family protein [Caulobacter sp.]
MRQFDLYENPATPMRGAVPFVVVLSSHLLGDLTEVVVAPVLAGRSAPLNAFEIQIEQNETRLLISITGMTAVRRRDLRRRIGSVQTFEDDIRRAIDRLFTGF